ncbi:MAG: hypothetical protein ACK4KV_09460 [Rhodocyclaceae bacterium]
MSIWHTHEETPNGPFEGALIAVPFEDGGEEEPVLLSQLYEWNGDAWFGQSDCELLEDQVFWWAFEVDVLNGLRNMLRRNHG